jgi:hypothetical protein
VSLVRLGRIPFALAALASIGAVGYVSLPLGQLVPVVAALLAGAALALRANRPRLAALCCVLASVEPHVGVPAVLALFVFEKRARVWLAGAALAAVGVSLAVAGPHVCLEYVRDVLPLHALSQVDRIDIQFSLTALLRALGASVPASILLGSIDYAAMTLLGIAVGGALARRTGDRAFVPAIAPAFALLGGTFVHLAQIGTVMPAAALIVAYAARPVARRFALAAVIALSIPWATVADVPFVAPLVWRHQIAARPVVLPASDASALAERTEIDFTNRGGYGENGGSLATILALKALTWFGLLALVTVAVRAAFTRPPGRAFGTPVAADRAA